MKLLLYILIAVTIIFIHGLIIAMLTDSRPTEVREPVTFNIHTAHIYVEGEGGWIVKADSGMTTE